MIKDSSKRCGRPRNVTLSITNAFFGKPWPTNLNKNLDLEENVLFFTKKWNTFENFITWFCVVCLFGKLISNNKLLFPNEYLLFIALLKPAVLSAILHVKTTYTTDGATISNDFPDALGIFQNILLCVLYIYMQL